MKMMGGTIPYPGKSKLVSLHALQKSVPIAHAYLLLNLHLLFSDPQRWERIAPRKFKCHKTLRGHLAKVYALDWGGEAG